MEKEHRCSGTKTEEGKRQHISRRHFVSAVGLATAGVIATSCSKAGNPLGDSSQNNLKEPIAPPSGQAVGANADDKAKVAINSISTYDYSTLRANLESAIEKIGGLGDLCKAGDTVGIKLNLTGGQSSADQAYKKFGLEPQELYLTHPMIMQIIAELFKDAGAGKIYMLEAINDFETWKRYGYEEATDYVGAELIDLNSRKPYSSFMDVTIPTPQSKFTTLRHNGILYDLDCFVSLPKVKRHYGAGITNTMKMMIGSTPKSAYNSGSSWRTDFHKSAGGSSGYAGNKNLVRSIVDLCQVRPLDLSVCDAIMTADNGEGPWNTGFKPIRYDRLITSKDPVAADAVGSKLMGFDPMAADKQGAFAGSSLPGNFDGTDNYLRIAEEVGLGVHDLSQIEEIDASIDTRVERRG